MVDTPSLTEKFQHRNSYWFLRHGCVSKYKSFCPLPDEKCLPLRWQWGPKKCQSAVLFAAMTLVMKPNRVTLIGCQETQMSWTWKFLKAWPWWWLTHQVWDNRSNTEPLVDFAGRNLSAKIKISASCQTKNISNMDDTERSKNVSQQSAWLHWWFQWSETGPFCLDGNRVECHGDEEF